MGQKNYNTAELNEVEEVTTELTAETQDKLQYLKIDSFIEGKVRNILDKDFEGISEFFNNVFFSFSECHKLTILVTRRCFLLAEWFLSYHLSINKEVRQDFELTTVNDCLCIINKKTKYRNYIISDKGISLLIFKSEIRNEIKKCMVVDDILIHGRQLDKIKEKLKYIFTLFGCNNVESIEKTVYMESFESAFLPAKNKYKISFCAKWIILSRRIVAMINCLNLPYVSYINSFTKYNCDYQENDSIISVLDNNEDLIVVPFGNDSRESYGKMSFYISERNANLANCEYLKCVRYYYNFKTKTSSFIPYVILNKQEEGLDDIGRIKELFGKYLVESALNILTNKIKGFIKNLKDTKDKKCKEFVKVHEEYDEYIVYLLSCVASNFYAYYFFKKYLASYNIEKWQNDTINCIKKAFGNDIYNIVSNKENYRNSYNNNNKKLYCSTDKELIENTKNIFLDKINTYCGNRWASCEEAAYFRKEKPKKDALDVVFNNVIQIVNTKNEDKNEEELFNKYMSFCNIIDLCDNGRLAIANDIVNSNIECVVEAGELGVLSARISKDEELQNKLKSLLSDKYYRYLLV